MSGLRLGPHHWVQGRVGEQQVPLQGRGTEVTTKMNEMFRIAGGSVPACLAKDLGPLLWVQGHVRGQQVPRQGNLRLFRLFRSWRS